MSFRTRWARRSLLSGCLLTLLAGCTSAPRLPPPSAEIDETPLRNDLRALASDEFEGRRPGTAGEQRSVAFLTEQLKKLGLQPGNGQSYVQPVPLVEVTVLRAAQLSVRGPAGVRALRYSKDMVIWTPRAAPAASLAQCPLVFAGYGVVAPEYDWNDYAGLDVHGKTVLVLTGDPGTATQDPRLFRGKTLSYYGRVDYKLAEAARQGAAGVLLIHDAVALGYGWQAVLNRWGAPALELESDADAPGNRPLLQGWLTQDAAHGLIESAGLDYPSLLRGASDRGFKARALALTVDAHLDTSIRRFTSDNVIALLPGGERKHEYVMYVSHWDGLGRDAAGAVLNGAEDDASGVAGLLTLAQSLSRTRPGPQRSIVFAAFTGGAYDRLGSRYYAEHPVFPLDRTSAVIDLERLHVGGRTRDVVVYGVGNSEVEESVRGIALLQGRDLRPDSRPQLGRYYGSDALSFALAGVPALYATAGTDDAARGPQWGEAQSTAYLANRYAQTADKYSEDWDLSGAIEDLDMDRQIGERLANSRRFPRWLPSSEFSASRSHPLPTD